MKPEDGLMRRYLSATNGFADDGSARRTIDLLASRFDGYNPHTIGFAIYDDSAPREILNKMLPEQRAAIELDADENPAIPPTPLAQQYETSCQYENSSVSTRMAIAEAMNDFTTAIGKFVDERASVSEESLVERIRLPIKDVIEIVRTLNKKTFKVPRPPVPRPREKPGPVSGVRGFRWQRISQLIFRRRSAASSGSLGETQKLDGATTESRADEAAAKQDGSMIELSICELLGFTKNDVEGLAASLDINGDGALDCVELMYFLRKYGEDCLSRALGKQPSLISSIFGLVGGVYGTVERVGNELKATPYVTERACALSTRYIKTADFDFKPEDLDYCFERGRRIAHKYFAYQIRSGGGHDDFKFSARQRIKAEQHLMFWQQQLERSAVLKLQAAARNLIRKSRERKSDGQDANFRRRRIAMS
jgi:hypothetical protein